MRFSTGIIPVLMLAASCLWADIPARPFPAVTTSQSGTCLFKMIPDKWHMVGGQMVVDRNAFGVAYSLDDRGEMQELWRTEGWYSFNVHLSDDGRYLVRMGPWASDEQGLSDLAIAFYDKGKLLKQYRVKDLLQNPKLIQRTSGHYFWQPARQTQPDGIRGGRFHLVTIDKSTYSFSIESGEIMGTGHDPGAKTYHEAAEEEDKKAEELGHRLLTTWVSSKSFQTHFEFLNVNADSRREADWSTVSTTWRGLLIPRKRYTYSSSVEAGFQVSPFMQILNTITPQDIDVALMRMNSHPFLAHTFNGEVGAVRLRVAGDRLYHSSSELREWLKAAGVEAPLESEEKWWANFVIDHKNPASGSAIVYLNVKTGELVFVGNGPKWPAKPMRFAPGKADQKP